MPIFLLTEDYEKLKGFAKSQNRGDCYKAGLTVPRPVDSDPMEAWRVSERVNHVKNNDAGQLER